MEPEVAQRDGFSVMGVVTRGKPAEIDFHAFWMNQFMAHHDRIKPLSTDPAYYGVCFETDEEGVIDYVAGMAVRAGTAAAEGLVVRDVPAERDAVFACTVETIGQTWHGIFGDWLASSPYEYDDAAPCYEHYPPDTKGQDSPVSIHVPVRQKQR
jgi:predicted transcriptional regulator YdeE